MRAASLEPRAPKQRTIGAVCAQHNRGCSKTPHPTRHPTRHPGTCSVAAAAAAASAAVEEAHLLAVDVAEGDEIHRNVSDDALVCAHLAHRQRCAVERASVGCSRHMRISTTIRSTISTTSTITIIFFEAPLSALLAALALTTCAYPRALLAALALATCAYPRARQLVMIPSAIICYYSYYKVASVGCTRHQLLLLSLQIVPYLSSSRPACFGHINCKGFGV